MAKYNVTLTYQVEGDITPKEAYEAATRAAGEYAQAPIMDVKVTRFSGALQDNINVEVRNTNVVIGEAYDAD